MENTISSDMYSNEYGKMDTVTPMWNEIQAKTGQVYAWSEASTYIQNPPSSRDGNWRQPINDIEGARVLLKLGDSVTTDHISPAGSFKPDTPR